MGVRPGVNLDKALRLAGELEDAEILRKQTSKPARYSVSADGVCSSSRTRARNSAACAP
jgi:hypothetical protein